MSLDTSGMLLEGIRVASGNNQLTFPARDIILDQGALNGSQSLGRAEYMLFVAGQAAGATGIEIADPNLSFFWSRNNASIVRFDYDMFGRRWNTLPGGPPQNIGTFGNSPRIAAPLPDTTVPSSEAPYALFIGIPRQTVFIVQVVASDTDFGTPPAGTVQVSEATGNLNWGPVDLANVSYQNQSVYVSQQSFNSRQSSKGIFGQLPKSSSASYLLYLNPIPGVGQIPRIRIGYQPYLTTVAYPTEAALTTPPTGSVAWSQDTGRVLFASADITANEQSNVYYDGVLLGHVTLTRTFIATILGPSKFFPNAIGINPLLQNANLDGTRYVFFAEPTGNPRYYFNVILQNSTPPNAPPQSISGPGTGQVVVDVGTGNIYISQGDAHALSGSPMYFVDSMLVMERGVGVQVFRSGINGGGAEQTPDFTEKYPVTEQVISSPIMGSPFATLPTIPLVDANLAFTVLPNTSGGTFVGPLRNNATSPLEATGYILNLDNKQVQYSSRKINSVTLDSPQPSIKLVDSAIFSQGFEVTSQVGTNPPVNLTPGVDFTFDPNSGILDFLQPIGEDDPKNILNIAGTATLPNTFVAGTAVFKSSDSTLYFLVSQGPNVNLYQITSVINSTTITVTPNFVATGSTNGDVRANREIVADRFFTNFTPPLRTFTLSKLINGIFTPQPQSAFTIFVLTGQVNLATPTNPGDVFQTSYVWQQSPDNGVTVTPTNVIELAAWKIRQETCTVVNNSSIINFNPQGKTVQTSKGITLYIDGVTQDPTSFNFIAPSTLTYNTNLTTANVVIIDYFVSESPGGNTSFFLTNSPISVDYPQIMSGATSSKFNGDQTSLLQTGGAFLLNTTDLILIGKVLYDPASDTTTVDFDNPTAYTNSPTGATPSPMQVCAPITGINAPTYMIPETNPVDLLSQGNNVISVNAQVNYSQNTVVLVNGDPYLVMSSAYDPTMNVTSVTLADKAITNYIIPVLQHTIRPVLQAGTDFQTTLSATLAFPFTLVDTGVTPRVLRQNLDYTVADGGTVKLTTSIGYGDVLVALYVGRVPQATGTVFTFNYAFAIAPTASNGLLGQQLAETYDLYAPDTFFYNIETIVTYIPIVIQTISQNTSAGTGPNIQSMASPLTKDQGTPSLYWPEVHFGNEDVVVQRLLKFYNDLINNYEDILSDLDGRVVGGVNGKFRYDGLLGELVEPLPYSWPSPLQWFAAFAGITNDIDDEVVLYFDSKLISLFPFIVQNDIPVFGTMYQPNNLSRIYPTFDPFVTVALNDRNFPILDYGNTIGSTGISNLTSVSTLISTRAAAALITSTSVGATNPLPIFTATTALVAFDSGMNGDSTNLIPGFSSGQTVQIYTPNGSPIPVAGSGALAAAVIVGGGVTISLTTGGAGYKSVAVIIEGDGTGATATAIVGGGGTITAINVTNAGVNYTAATVTIVGTTGITGTVSSVAGPDANGYITLGIAGVAVTQVGGGVVQVPANGAHYYTPGRDFNINNSLGIFTSNFLDLPSPPFPGVTHISGNELVDTQVTFANSDSTPRRIPVLDGSTLSDNGRPAVPALTRIGETAYLTSEFASLNDIGFGSASGTTISQVLGFPFPQPSIGASGSAATIAGISGGGASITTFDSNTGLMTVIGLSNMSSSFVGGSILLTNCLNPSNDGIFIIASYDSTSSGTAIQVTNVVGVAPDVGGSGGIKWQLTGSDTAASITSSATPLITVGGLRWITPGLVGSQLVLSGAANGGNNGSFLITAIVSPPAPISGTGSSAAAITAVTGSFMTVTGLSGLTANDIGFSLTLSGAATGTNNGSFRIVAVLSVSSALVANTNPGTAPDANNGSIKWVIASDSIQITNSNGAANDGHNGSISWSIAPTGLILNGLNNVAITDVGTPITIHGSTHSSNNGAFVIASFISSISAVIINSNAVVPDAGPLTWSIIGTNTIVFVDGPNAGVVFTATGVGLTTITVTPAFVFPDGGSDYYIVQPQGDLVLAVQGEVFVLNDTVAEPVAAPALIPSINSELASINTVIESYGQTQTSGVGSPTAATVFTDPAANYAVVQPPITSSSLLYIADGPNLGLYQIASITNTTITVAPGPPFPVAFPSIGTLTAYIIIQPWSFLSTQEFSFASDFQQNTLAFYNSTLAWSNAITALGAAARTLAVSARQMSVTNYITTIEGLLGQNDNLYNTRYLWIQQRTDKSIGLLIQQAQAASQRVTNTANLVSAQQKLFIMNLLLKAL